MSSIICKDDGDPSKLWAEVVAEGSVVCAGNTTGCFDSFFAGAVVEEASGGVRMALVLVDGTSELVDGRTFHASLNFFNLSCASCAVRICAFSNCSSESILSENVLRKFDGNPSSILSSTTFLSELIFLQEYRIASAALYSVAFCKLFAF